MSGNLAFNGFLQGPLKEEAQASRTVLKIFCRSSFVYLVTKGLEEPTARGLTGALS